jgi:Domain of unknown function (DUF4111)
MRKLAGTAGPLGYGAELTAEMGAALGGALAGAYLHGSAALGGWHADRSDVDVLFLTGDELTGALVASAATALLSAAAGCPGRGLEASVVTAAAAARPAPPWPFVLHIGTRDGAPVLYRGEDRAGDADLLMHYVVCRAAGLTLAGPPPGTAIGPVDRRLILAYLADELDWGLASAPESYAVLNACRALAYLRHGRIISKVDGGLAALAEGAGPPGVVRGALDQQRAVLAERTAGPAAVAFVREVQAALRAEVGAAGAGGS